MNRIANSFLALCLLALATVAHGDERSAVQQVQDVVKRYYDAWNQQDFVAAEDLIAHSVVEFSMRNRKEPQTWVLQKLQPREDYLDAITEEWNGGDGEDYDPDTHKYIKEIDFFDTYIWDDRAMVIVGERLVGLSGPAGQWRHNAWLLSRDDNAWKIAGTLYEIDVDYAKTEIETRENYVRMRLFIDGSDEVFIDDEGLWIEHHSNDLPGRHHDGDGFSPAYINDIPWQPIWQGDKTRKVYFQRPLARPAKAYYKLVKHESRNIAQIEVEPQKPGDPISVLFADDDDGADWYDVELRWSEKPFPPGEDLPEPIPPGREDLLLEVLFDDEIRDTSPHERPLKNKDIALTKDRADGKNRAGYFNGKAVVDIEGFLIDGPFSVSIWAKYDEVEERSYWWNNCIWAQDDGGDTRVFQLSTHGRRATWHRMRDEDLHSKLYLNAGRWYHFVALYDGDYHRLYVDDVLQEQKQSTVKTSPTQSIYIGAKNLDETDFFFTGALDDARLYSRVLTEAEISALYQGLSE